MDETSATRIGDADRQQVLTLLSRAFSDGRITYAEFDERSSQAVAAVTRHDLDVLIADLPPGVQPAPAPAPRPAPAPQGYAPPSGGYPAAYPPSGGYPHPPLPPQKRSFVGIMSASRAKGRWKVPPVVSGVAFWGAAIIDLREAEFQSPEVMIRRSP